jgi:hypothetical protein
MLLLLDIKNRGLGGFQRRFSQPWLRAKFFPVETFTNKGISFLKTVGKE